MKIEYSLSVPARCVNTEITPPKPILCTRPVRVTCLLALAHRFEELVRSCAVRDYAEIARLGGVSRARVSQILNLLTLAPSIQEHILWLPPRQIGQRSINERDLRAVVREPRWDRQRILFEELLDRLRRGRAESRKQNRRRVA